MTKPVALNLRVLSLNIQVGLETTHYRQYVTKAWRHAVPTRGAYANLERIAALAANHDVVALQEADAGSLRTARVNQVAHLAQLAGFPYWHAAVTRDLGPFAQHCLGVLSRWPLLQPNYHSLPGILPGRGALEVSIQPAGHELLRVIVAHLALTRRARAGQLHFLANLARGESNSLILGDFNCERRELDEHAGIQAAGLRSVHAGATFPSWAPTRALDHLLLSPGLVAHNPQVLPLRLSDHLPISSEIKLNAVPENTLEIG
ncbi:MAG: endonuclease/exonuclease/phosphatase family protein [Pseudomonadota bacterium]